MQKLIKALFTLSMFLFVVLSVFFVGRLATHSISGAYMTPHQMLRSLIITGGASVLLYLTQLLFSVREMNYNYRESSRWS